MVMNMLSKPEAADDHAPALSTRLSHVWRLIYQRWRRVIARWIERRRERYALSKLDDHALADIGVTRSEAARQAAKPFWR